MFRFPRRAPGPLTVDVAKRLLFAICFRLVANVRMTGRGASRPTPYRAKGKIARARRIIPDMPPERSLEEQRAEFASRRLIAMPIAGTIAWALVGVAGLFLSPWRASMALFVATGSILYLGMAISKLTGENMLDRSRPKNVFDRLFFYGVIQALLVYAIAIPFFLKDHTSLPLTVGILTGLMWMPLSWIIDHWAGLFHSIGRTVIVLMVWLAFPQRRFVAVPFAIVGIYLITIVVLELRWRGVRSMTHDAMRRAM
jgi:hypothetical protein